MAKKWSKKEINEYLGTKQISQDNYVAPTVRVNTRKEPSKVESNEPTIRSIESTVNTLNSVKNNKPKSFEFTADDKKQPSLGNKLGFVAKSGGAGLTSGLTGIVDAPLQNMQEGAKKGKNKSNLENYVKGALKTLDIYGISNIPEIVNESSKIMQDKNKKGWEKALNIGGAILNNNPIVNSLEASGQQMNILNKNAEKDIAKTRQAIETPSNKLNEKVQKESQNMGKGWQLAGEVNQTIGNMLPSMAATAITKNPNIGLAAMGVSVKGQATKEAEDRGANLNEANQIGLAKGLTEVGTETLTGGLKFLGKGSADDLVEKGINKIVKNKTGNFVAKQLAGIGGEIGEETISDLVGTAIDKATVDPDATYTFDDWKRTALTTMLSTGALNTISGGYSKQAYQLNAEELEQIVQNEKVQKAINERVEQLTNPNMTPQEVAEIRQEATEVILGEIQQNVDDIIDSAKQEIQQPQIPTQTPLNALNQGVREQNVETPYQTETPQITPLNQVNQELQETRKNDIADSVQAMNLEKQPEFKQKQGNYVYEKHENPKIDTLRQDIAKHFTDSEETRNFAKTLEKIIEDKNVDIRFNPNLRDSQGRIANGSYSNGVITLNPNSNRAGEFLAIHELTHAIGTKPMIKMIENYRKSNAEFNNAVEKLLGTYNATEINEEALADISGQLFGNQEYINKLSTENKNLFNKLYNEIKYLWHQLRGYKNQNEFIEDLYHKWDQAYRRQKVQQKAKNSNIEMSTQTDSNGNMLSNEQVDYFKDSKVKDDKGQLIPVYRSGFNQGTDKVNGFFTQDKNLAEYFKNYFEEEGVYPDEGDIYETYLNITNPLEVDANGNSYQDIDFEGGVVTSDELVDIAKERGYNGLIIRNVLEGDDDYGGFKTTDYVTFEPNQAKNIDNLTPTQDDDIRYSINEDKDLSYQGVQYDKAHGKGITVDQFMNKNIKLYDNMKNSTEAIEQLNNAKDNPDAEITIYRATPSNSINTGDWVFLDKEHAERLTKSLFSDKPIPGYKVVEEKVKAKDVDWTGKNLEFVYSPDTNAKTETITKDSQGRELSKQQQEYFKDSKIRNDKGELLEVYHGTNNDFTVFDKSYLGSASGDVGFLGDGFYFATHKGEADYYGGKSMKTYLNVTNPYNIQDLHKYKGMNLKGEDSNPYIEIKNLVDMNPEWKDIKIRYGNTYGDIANATDEILNSISVEDLGETDNGHQYKVNVGNNFDIVNTINNYSIDELKADAFTREMRDKFGFINSSDVIQDITDEARMRKLNNQKAVKTFSEVLEENGYDGIIQGEKASDTDEIVVFNPNQIKNVDNTNPTEDPDIRYSKDNQTWREYLEKEFPNQGTRTKLQDINERNKPKQENKTIQEEKPQEMPKKEVKQEVKKSYLTNAEQNELENLRELDNTGLLDENDSDYKRLQELEKKSQGITTKYPELKTKNTFDDIKSIYGKYKNSEISKSNKEILNKAKSFIDANSQGRRTIEQWKQVAEFIGSNADIKNSQDLQKLAIETWINQKPNTKEQLNRQGKKYVPFAVQDWVNAVYKGAGVGTDVKMSKEENTINENKQEDKIVLRTPTKIIPKEIKTPKQQQEYFEESGTPKKVAKILSETPRETETSNLREKYQMLKRAVVDKGEAVYRISKQTKNRKLYAMYDRIGLATGEANYNIGDAQTSLDGTKYNNFTDDKGKKTSMSLKQIWDDAEKSGVPENVMNEYLAHYLNIDRYKSNQLSMEESQELKDLKKYKNLSKVQKERLAELEALSESRNVFGETITREDSRNKVKEIEYKYPQIKRSAENIWQYGRNQLQNMVDAGLVSKESQEYYNETTPHYVRIQRVNENNKNSIFDKNGHLQVNNQIKKAKGGTKDIIPFKDSMAQYTLDTVSSIRKNLFGQELGKTLNNGLDIDENIDIDNLENNILNKNDDGSYTFKIYKDGKPEILTIDKGIYEALQPNKHYDFEKIFTPFRVASNLKRGLLTDKNPLFLVSNFFKDVFDAPLNTKHSTVDFVKNYGEAVNQIITNGEYFQKYKALGGNQNTYFDREGFNKDSAPLKEQYNKISGTKDALKFGFNAVLTPIEKGNNFIETLPRLSEFITSVKKGESLDEAMYNAAEITTNFKRGGTATKLANRNGATFLNASVQGFDKQIRNFAEIQNPKQATRLLAKGVLLGIAPALLNAVMYDDDDEYEDLPDYIKDSYYLFKTDKDNKWIRIPKGRAISVIQAAARRTYDYSKGNKDAYKGLIGHFTNQLAPNNPLDSNVLSPFIDVANNKSWSGSKIVSDSIANETHPEEEYDAKTDEFSKWLGKKLGKSPKKINYILDQTTGGIGDLALPFLTKQAEGEDESLSGRILKNPVRDKFTTDAVLNSKQVNQFYDAFNKAEDDKKWSKATDDDKLRYKYLYSTMLTLADYNKQIKEIESSNKSDKDKYKETKELKQEMNEISRKAVKESKNIDHKGSYAQIGNNIYKKEYDKETGEHKYTKVPEKQLEKLKSKGVSLVDYFNEAYERQKIRATK